LTGKYLSLTGQVNLVAAVSAVIEGNNFNYMPLQDIPDASLLDVLRNIVGISLNGQSAVNEIVTRFGEPIDKVFLTAPSKTKFSINLMGVIDAGLENDIHVVKAVKDFHADENAYGYEIKEGRIWDTPVKYSEQEVEGLIKVAIPVIVKLPIAGKAVQVPVYVIRERDPDGKERHRMMVLTPRAIRKNIQKVEHDIKTYENYAKANNEFRAFRWILLSKYLEWAFCFVQSSWP